MKKLPDIMLTMGIVSLIFFGGYYIYSANLFNSTQAVASSSRKPLVVSDSEVTDSHVETIHQEAIKNDQANLNRVGTVAVPDLGILLPIYNKPYDEQALLVGAQQLDAKGKDADQATIGKGNFLLVAHNYTDGKKMFSPLQQNMGLNAPYLVNRHAQDNHWLDGKKIYLANDKGLYEYTIDVQHTIPEYRTDIQNNTDKPEINVITCLEPDDSWRIDTHGNLSQKWSWDQAPSDIINYFDLNKQQFNK